MMLTKGADNRVTYLLPQSSPPSAMTWGLNDPAGNAHATAQAVTVPSSYAASSAAAGTNQGDVTVTCSTTPTGIAPGSPVRVLDTWGQAWDAICAGRNAKLLRLVECGCNPSEVASVWCPEVAWTVSAALLDETGEAWSMPLAWTVDGQAKADTLYPTVCRVSLALDISPRDYLSLHPEAATDLSALERRRDWPQLIATAKQLTEDRLRAADRWYAAVMSPAGLRRLVVECCHLLLAPSNVPENFAATPDAWLTRAEQRVTEAASDCLATAKYDADQDGTADDDETIAMRRQTALTR
jgi:hypothetical protein